MKRASLFLLLILSACSAPMPERTELEPGGLAPVAIEAPVENRNPVLLEEPVFAAPIMLPCEDIDGGDGIGGTGCPTH